MVSAMFTGGIITSFEGLLNSSAVGIILTSCIPMMMDTGGNCGSQVSTLVIRGMALGEIEFRDLPRVLWKELRVALLVGAILAIGELRAAAGFRRRRHDPHHLLRGGHQHVRHRALRQDHRRRAPMVAKKAHLDPALMASPLITTIVDACSLTILFSIATALLTF